MSKLICLIVLLIYFCLSPSKVLAENSVAINEFFAHPISPAKEWVEFYNPNNIDLTGYYIDDDTSFTDETGSNIQRLTQIVQGQGYDYFELYNFLNNSGDHVVLFDQNGNIADQYEYVDDPGIDVSIGRSPDGTGEFQILASATKGSANSAVIPTATLTPTVSPTPTKEPTPTKTPTPIKTPTPTKAPTKSPTFIPTKTPTPSPAKTPSSTAKSKTASLSAVPTSILGASTSASPTLKASQGKPIDSGNKNSIFNGIAFVIGSIFLIACGILIFLKIRKRESYEADDNN